MMNEASFYDINGGEAFYTRWGKKLLYALDISENMNRFLDALTGIRNGWVSLGLLIVSIFCFNGIGSLAYAFDIHSSWEAMNPVRTAVQAATAGLAVSSFLAWFIGLVPFSLTVMPTGIEMLGSRFARFDIPAFQVLVWFFIGFDIMTDIPMINATVGPYWSHFVPVENPGFFDILFSPRLAAGVFGFYFVWTLALLAASFFLEVAAVLLFSACVLFFVKSIGYWTLGFLAGHKWFNGWVSNLVGQNSPRGIDPQEARRSRRAQEVGPMPRQGRRSRRAPQTPWTDADMAAAQAADGEELTDEEVEQLLREEMEAAGAA
jgi:hypothetical protein